MAQSKLTSEKAAAQIATHITSGKYDTPAAVVEKYPELAIGLTHFESQTEPEKAKPVSSGSGSNESSFRR